MFKRRGPYDNEPTPTAVEETQRSTYGEAPPRVYEQPEAVAPYRILEEG